MNSTHHFASSIYKLMLIAAATSGVWLAFLRPVDYGLSPLYFFTIQTNILVVLAVIYFLLFKRLTRLRAVVRGSVMLAIVVTGLVFHFLLVPYYPDFFGEGLSFRDHLTHTIVPLGYVLDWLFFDRKKQMLFIDIGYFLIYPFLYWLFSVSRGAVTGFYPYYFMDVGNLGFSAVLLWLFILTLFFVLIASMIIMIDNLDFLWQNRRKDQPAHS